MALVAVPGKTPEFRHFSGWHACCYHRDIPAVTDRRPLEIQE